MSVMLLVMSLWLLLQGCCCDPVNLGCMDWDVTENEIACCKTCFPGHRLVKKCGPVAKDLCTPCAPGTYTLSLNDSQCTRCTQCAGAQVQLKACTSTADTKCGCKEGLTCGDDHCSFCVLTCTKGQEPTDDGSCRPCPNGTFNDKIHQKCKRWSTKCPKLNQRIAAKGDAFTDIKCVDVSNLKSVTTTTLRVDTSVPKAVTTTTLRVDTSVPKAVTTAETPVSDPKTVVKVEPHGNADIAWFLVLPLVVGIILMVIFTVFSAIAKTKDKKIPRKPIIRPPSDDPQTLIAIECSFHEAEQEQGSSSESLFSKDSSEQLIT